MTNANFRILLVLDGLWAGGTERSLAGLAPYLERDGIEPIFVCFRRRPENSIEADVVAAGHEVVFLEAPTLRSQVAGLRREIRARRPTIVHASLYQACLASRFAGIGQETVILNSLVNTPYEPLRIAAEPRLRGRKARFKHRVVQQIDAWTARLFADHLHAVSGAAKDAAIRALGVPADRITVVERGRDPERLGKPSSERREAARAKFGIPKDAELIVNVGRQDPQKGHVDLLHAIARLTPSRPRLQVRIAGRPGASTSQIEQLLDELNLRKHVVFLGHLSDVSELLAAADLFAFPSYFEGLPGAVIEASALGLPVVGHRIPPVAEVVRDDVNGRLVEPGDVEALTREFEAMLDDPERSAVLGVRGREMFLERFTSDRSAQGMIEMYRRLAA